MPEIQPEYIESREDSRRIPRIGSLRHRVSIQERTESKDADGYLTPSWANIGTDPTVWAAIAPTVAMEAFEGGQRKVTGVFSIWIRDRTDVTSQNRISATIHSQARVFEILGVERRPFERPKFLKLMCREFPGQ